MSKPRDNPDSFDFNDQSIAYGAADAAFNGCEWRAAAAAMEDYLFILSKNLEKFRIKEAGEDIVDAVHKSIENFAPYRDEAVDLFASVARYAPTEDNIRILHRFFESLIHYMDPPANLARSYRKCEFDNFKFIIHELFLCWVAALLKRERFVEADAFLSEKFYLDTNASYGDGTLADYCIFDPLALSLSEMSKRKERLCFEADLLKARANSTLKFEHLQQADLALYIRGEIHHRRAHYAPWYPTTLMYTTDFPQVFEIFARSASTKYFESSKRILGISQKEDLLKAMQHSGQVEWKGRTIAPKTLLGYEQLATLP